MTFNEDFINVLKQYGKLPYESPVFKLEQVKQLHKELDNQKETTFKLSQEMFRIQTLNQVDFKGIK